MWPGGAGGSTSSASTRPPGSWPSPGRSEGAMRGRDFLIVARELARKTTEAHWRAATGRAYYALLLELRDGMTGWGLSQPAPSQVHQLVARRLFVSADQDVKQIGIWFEQLRKARGRAEYETWALAEFGTDAGAKWAVQRASDALALFDAIQAAPPRRATIAAQIKAVLP